MNEILAVVAFLVLVGLLASRMEPGRGEHAIEEDSHKEAESSSSVGGVTATAPELAALAKKPIPTRVR